MGTPIPAALQRAGLPDIVVAVYGSGRHEARLRGSREVVAEAVSSPVLILKLKEQYPEGFLVEYREDPHM